MSVVRVTFREQVKDTLMRRIVDGTYPPGTRLIELKLAREFGVSQAPVREAIREIETIGLVLSQPHKGAVVGDFAARVDEAYTVRGALEEAATRLAVGRLGDIAALQAEVDAMADAATRRDIEALKHHSVAFHRLIVEACGNQLLASIWNSLQIETRTTLTLLHPDLDLMQAALSHQPIVDAIASGDSERAARVAREHQAYFEEATAPRQSAPAPKAAGA
ncbi:GntR family transcriptional regulator [Labrys wisconsinensis]|uniref:DNA-binding GntR family transcriptional regulator n=1 Tax=Labrys wisconsinensis TaxID=425677 RepID=A0ABU0J865_9HYPH|nr:GntR family transcriptional regulator [Labrys wisconsinensis]MDQ0469618.1 DNA-binding GntR family transcriptional regulator [Labrys wisconsinensis]